MQYSIEFDGKELKFVCVHVWGEVFGGGSTAAIQAVLGDQVEAARVLGVQLEAIYRAQFPKDSLAGDAAISIELSEPRWRLVYDSINAVVYGLGPFELSTCTHLNLAEACNLNLKICSSVWGFYGDADWET